VIETFTLLSSYNNISGLITIPEGNKKYPCVILSHGLISSKESSKYIALSESLAEKGIASCRFDYHGCGESGGDISATTLTIRTENLDSVFQYIFAHHFIDREKIGILGSSFGGATCIIKASKDKRVKCIALLATPYQLDKKEDETIPGVQLKETIYEDFFTYDILAEAKNISCALVIHGEDDEVVPYQEGKAIYQNIKRPKRWELIRGADHTFSNPSHREKVITLAVKWFRDYLVAS